MYDKHGQTLRKEGEEITCVSLPQKTIDFIRRHEARGGGAFLKSHFLFLMEWHCYDFHQSSLVWYYKHYKVIYMSNSIRNFSCSSHMGSLAILLTSSVIIVMLIIHITMRHKLQVCSLVRK